MTYGQVTRSGQVTLPRNVNFEVCNPTKPTVVEIWSWNPQEIVKSSRATTCISRNFYIDDLRSGHFCDRPIISQWEKFQLTLNAILWLQYAQDHSITGPCWWFHRNISLMTFGRWSPGHLRSPEVTSGFSSITWDWVEIETPFDVYRVFLVNADRMICNMTYFGQVMTLTWGQFFNLTFRGHIIYHSMRLDELRTMAFESILCLVCKTSYSRKTTAKFLLWKS